MVLPRCNGKRANFDQHKSDDPICSMIVLYYRTRFKWKLFLFEIVQSYQKSAVLTRFRSRINLLIGHVQTTLYMYSRDF